MILRVARASYVVSLALWFGGFSTLGAVVAPLVFRIVHAPASADAMTAVFQRFDRVALVSALVAAVSEAVFAWKAGPRRSGVDWARRFLVALGTLLLVWEAVAIAPTIAQLHAGGAVRGFGEDGLTLESVHRLAERVARIEVFAVLGALVLFAIRPPTEPGPPA